MPWYACTSRLSWNQVQIQWYIYSLNSSHLVLSDEYPCARVSVIFLCFLNNFALAELITNSTLGLRISWCVRSNIALQDDGYRINIGLDPIKVNHARTASLIIHLIMPHTPPSQPERSNAAWQIWWNHSGKSKYWKIFEGEMSIRTLAATLIHIFCKIILDSWIIVKSIVDPDDNLSRNS